MHENPLLYVHNLQAQSMYVEHESTSIFERDEKPPLMMRQLQFLQQQRRSVSLRLDQNEKIIGTIMRLESEHVWIMTEQGAICISYNTIRTIQ